jgi:hypothetical protein
MTRAAAAGAALTFLASTLLPFFAPAGATTSPRREVVKVTAYHGTKDGPTRAPYAAAPATTRRAYPRPATRSYRRPPLAEETRWRSTSASKTVTSKPSGGPHTARHGACGRCATSTKVLTPITDLQRARSLPEPWRSIVRCESVRDGSWRVASPSRARGWFQFLPSTWRSLGLSGDPAAAPFSVQYSAARRLARRDGLRAWTCAHLLGLA